MTLSSVRWGHATPRVPRTRRAAVHMSGICWRKRISGIATRNEVRSILYCRTEEKYFWLPWCWVFLIESLIQTPPSIRVGEYRRIYQIEVKFEDKMTVGLWAIRHTSCQRAHWTDALRLALIPPCTTWLPWISDFCVYVWNPMEALLVTQCVDMFW